MDEEKEIPQEFVTSDSEISPLSSPRSRSFFAALDRRSSGTDDFDRFLEGSSKNDNGGSPTPNRRGVLDEENRKAMVAFLLELQKDYRLVPLRRGGDSLTDSLVPKTQTSEARDEAEVAVEATKLPDK